MNNNWFSPVWRLVLSMVVAGTMVSCATDTTNISDTSDDFTVQITDSPQTFCNPITLSVGSERARRAGEPVVALHQDDYYLFVSGGGGYWISDNMRDWRYVDAPDFPGGCPSVVSDGETMYASGDKSRREVFASTDPANGVWEQVGYHDREYGDANLFLDDDGRWYMYWGWSQLLPFQVVELDPENGFSEKGEPVTLFFGNPDEHGFERKRADDLIFPYITHRDYLPEEIPWIEGPWIVKQNGTYYLQYAAIGLEFSTYSHGIYTSDNPLGPFEYSPHNPLTFKTTGYFLGAGHGSTFADKNGQFWTIAMIPAFYGGRGGGELAIFPTDIDADGIMHSNTAFSDYPQYYPGVKRHAVENNFTGWMLLSHKKYTEASSTLEGFDTKDAVDEDFMTYWCAETGEAGEYLTIDLGVSCDIRGVQVNFDQHDATVAFGRGMGGGNTPDRYQSFTIHISDDNEHWSLIVDKSSNTVDNRHDYTELSAPVQARYVKVTNEFTPDEGKFAIKDVRVFGNPDQATFTIVDDVMVVRDPDDPRDATITWQPVVNADGYVVRYGVAPGKLYNNYMVYDTCTVTMHSLNRDEPYYFEVEAFDSGTEYYREPVTRTMGLGAEIELAQGRAMIERKMIVEGIDEYVFENIAPGTYNLRHTFGPTMWTGELTEDQLIGSGEQPSLTEKVSDLGTGLNVLGQMDIMVIPGVESGKIIVTLNYE